MRNINQMIFRDRVKIKKQRTFREINIQIMTERTFVKLKYFD